MMKCYLRSHNFSELGNLSSRLVFGVISGHIFISLAFRECKKDCSILKIILVQVFCPLKDEITRLPIGFSLKATARKYFPGACI